MPEDVKRAPGVQKGYKVILSSGPAIPFDPGELSAVLEAIKRGDAVKLKQGFFNPSFFVSIVEDTERRGRFLEDTRLGTAEQIQAMRDRGMDPLEDVFSNVLSIAAATAPRLSLPARASRKPDHGTGM